MKNLFDKQPISDEAPQGLRNKVEYASRQEPRKAWFAPRYRWAAAGTAVAAAVAGVMFIMPSSAEAKTWDMVQDAYGKVRGMLIQMRFDEPNGESGEMLIAGKGNDWRVSFSESDRPGPNSMDISYSGGELMIWDGGDTAQVISLGMNLPFQPEQVMQGMAEQLTASKIFEQHADDMGRQNIRVEQPVVVDGRRVYNVFISDPDNAGNQVHVVVDAETDLPISMEMQGVRGESMQMTFQFNGEFDRSLLQPVLPSGVKFKHTDFKSMGTEGEDMFQGLEQFGKTMEDMHKDGKSHEDKDEVRIERAVKLG